MVNTLFKAPKIYNVLEKYIEDDILESSFDFNKFDNSKNLFDYQIKALQNAFLVLNKFYNEFNADKRSFHDAVYRDKVSTFVNQNPSEILLDNFENDGTSSKKRIEFYQFCNQMGFWMTTGSGKTIVAIKLIQMLDYMIKEGLIPKKDIFFFTAREDLLKNFENEVKNFNDFNDAKIELIDLKRYESTQNSLDFGNIKVYCYRTDLISDDDKENIVDYKNYLNNGNNFLILDEAHKGDKQDSKRQNIFSALSKNGFLFNFSATFTDDIDITTTVYNLNQLEWIKQGYGKKVVLLDSNLDAFKNRSDLNDDEKEISLLKSLILLTFQKQNKIPQMYHNPLMVVFLNSVNTDDADAKLFFKCIERICKSNEDENFKKARDILKQEFKEIKFILTDDKGDEDLINLADKIAKISLDDVRSEVFYASGVANVEAKFNPNQSKELVFKLDSSNTYFMLLRIGDAKSWKQDILGNIKVVSGFDGHSYFENIDENSINILVGSRSFYEGWDTTRPNMMLFLNIGMDRDSKKFITQCIGRGMRIESTKGKRQRLAYLDENFEDGVKNNSALAETLFIYATSKDSISGILNWQNELIKQSGDFKTVSLTKTKLDGKILFIPRYKAAKKRADKISKKQNFTMSGKNIEQLRIYKENISDELFILRHKFELKSDLDSFKNMVDENSFYQKDEIYYKDLNFMIERLKDRFIINCAEFDKFSEINNEIIHFEKIQVNSEKVEEFIRLNDETVALNPLSDDEIEEKIKKGEIKFSDTKTLQKDELVLDDLTFKKIKNHYYNAILYGKDLEWIKNIINNESEIEFIKEVANIKHNLDEKYDWWMFSRINEHYDDVFIPYIKDAKSSKFYPDFIFWLQNGNTQKIVFIDPKGTSHVDYQHKADGFKEIFNKKEYRENGFRIKVELYFYDITNASKPNEYKNFWIDKGGLKNII